MFWGTGVEGCGYGGGDGINGERRCGEEEAEAEDQEEDE